jgi:carboxymethylenebutenolidase
LPVRLLTVVFGSSITLSALTVEAPVSNAQTGSGGEGDYVVRMAHVHSGETPVANASAIDPKVDVTGEEVTYGTLNGTPLRGYLAYPTAAGKTRLPGVVMIHEWWGLNDNIRAAARRLAGEGYTVLAVDLYGGKSATTPDSAQQLAQSVGANPDAALANIHAANTYLRSIRHARKVATIGWCFGGTWSLRAALLDPEHVDAAVVYYGEPDLDLTHLSQLRAPLLGFYGGADQGIPVEKVRGMQDILDSLGKRVTIKIYPGAKHAFANPSGPSYEPAAANDAWQLTTEFLARNLKK